MHEAFPSEPQGSRRSQVDRGFMQVRSISTVVLACSLLVGTAFGQNAVLKTGTSEHAAPPTASTPTPEEAPKDSLGRDTPYATVVGFLKAAEHGDWEHAAVYLDSKQPPATKQELARELKLVLDRGLKLDLEKISKNPLGSPTEKWRLTRNEIGTARIDDHTLPILIDLIQPTAKRPPYWLFAAETVMGVPEIAANLEAPWFEKYVPKILLENRIFGIQLFRWITIPVFISLGFALVWLATWVICLGAERILRKPDRQNVVVSRSRLLGPLRILLLAYLLYLAAPFAGTLVARHIWRHIAVAVTIAGIGWLLIRALDLAEEIAEARFKRENALSRITHFKLSNWVLRATVALGTLVSILYVMEINATTLVTGLGLGGIALAFAAQKTIENVFGTVMIVVDRPVRVGDFCKVGDFMGTIEEIGLRSTRLRTMDRTLVVIPNGQLAATMAENYASRERFWFRHIIGLRHETTADQLRYVLEEIRAYLKAHSKVEPGTFRVRFIRFGGSSLDLEIFAYVLLADYSAFLGVQEELLLRIMDIIAEAGTSVAFPSQTTYLAKDSGLDAEKSQAAVERIRNQRNGVLAQ